MNFPEKYIKESSRFLTNENIRNHFIVNPAWEEVFKKHYTIESTDKTNYYTRCYDIFIKNGYRFEELRPFKSEKLKSVMDIAFYNGDEWLFEQGGNEIQIFGQLIIGIICDYKVDFSTFI